MSAYTEAVAVCLAGLEAVSPGAIVGCPSCHELPGEEEGHFSWRPCEACGSRFGGDRHTAHGLWKKEVLGNTKLEHLSICSDCLIYLANGDEPVDWNVAP